MTDQRTREEQAIDREIVAYEQMKAELERHHRGKWVIVYSGQLAGAFDTFTAAASDARRQFGRGPFLIRQVGAPPIRLPASVLFRQTTVGA